VSGKKIPNIFDRNVKKNYQILIIFDTNISDTTGDQIALQFFYRTHCLFLHYLGKQNQRNIAFFIPFCLLGFTQVVQKQTFGKMGTTTVI